MPTHHGKKRNECYEKIIAGRCWTVLVKKIKKDCLMNTLINFINGNESNLKSSWMSKQRYAYNTLIICVYYFGKPDISIVFLAIR